jgi:hypothetical protein
MSERMRIDSSGNIQIAKTARADDTVGHSLQADGLAVHTRDGAELLFLNRKTSDGKILSVRKDNTEVGSIGSREGRMFLYSPSPTGSGIRMGDAFVMPCDSDGSDSDNDTALGQSNSRFTDLYLSGGVYLGGTGSANKLDDYEEGTFIPTLTPSTSGSVTINNSQNELKYIKISNTVFVQGRLEITSSSSPVGSNLNIGNLPFTPTSSSEGSGWFGGMCAVSFNGSATFSAFPVWALTTTAKITTTVASINSNTRLHFNFFYETS